MFTVSAFNELFVVRNFTNWQ